MVYRKHQILRSAMKILGLILLIITSAGAEEKRDMGGWGLGMWNAIIRCLVFRHCVLVPDRMSGKRYPTL